MGRIEAGQWPPLHPRRNQPEQQHSARPEIQSPLTIFESTEKFRTGNEGLFSAVRAELAHNVSYIPRVRLPKDPEQTITVAIASNNNIKVGRMQELVSEHSLDVIRIPEAQEWHTKDVILDATSKAVDAARLIQESEQEARREVRNRPHVTMATDQLNAVPVVVEDPTTNLPVIAFKRLGKPNNAENIDPIQSVRQTFWEMAQLAQMQNWETVPYIIELATVIHNPKDPKNNAVSTQKSVVFLSREGVEHLATDRFDEYVEKVGKTFDITAIAGGIELKVLEEMGIVQLVTGTPEEVTTTSFPPVQRTEARDHAYRLALGHADEHLVKNYFAENTNAIN